MLGAIGAVVVGTVETTVVVETVGSSMVALVDSVVVSRPVKVIYTVLFFSRQETLAVPAEYHRSFLQEIQERFSL